MRKRNPVRILSFWTLIVAALYGLAGYYFDLYLANFQEPLESTIVNSFLFFILEMVAVFALAVPVAAVLPFFRMKFKEAAWEAVIILGGGTLFALLTCGILLIYFGADMEVIMEERGIFSTEFVFMDDLLSDFFALVFSLKALPFFALLMAANYVERLRMPEKENVMGLGKMKENALPESARSKRFRALENRLLMMVVGTVAMAIVLLCFLFIFPAVYVIFSSFLPLWVVFGGMRLVIYFIRTIRVADPPISE